MKRYRSIVIFVILQPHVRSCFYWTNLIWFLLFMQTAKRLCGQSVRMYRLIWSFSGHLYKKRFQMDRHIWALFISGTFRLWTILPFCGLLTVLVLICLFCINLGMCQILAQTCTKQVYLLCTYKIMPKLYLFSSSEPKAHCWAYRIGRPVVSRPSSVRPSSVRRRQHSLNIFS